MFAYGQKRTPESVTLQGPPHVLQRLVGQFAQYLKLKIWVDQIGSIRVLSTEDNKPVKVMEYDSFGNITHETRSEWRFPLGYAGGLNDAYTGFVRFGFRDYDPQVGRFTAKDPIGDTGGDHDLWNYCVDDPVSKIDPLGLEERSLWDRFWAWYSPLLFGNDAERKKASDSLYKSLKKETEALAGGYVDAITILPSWIPTSLGLGITENLTSLPKPSTEIRNAYQRHIEKK